MNKKILYYLIILTIISCKSNEILTIDQISLFYLFGENKNCSSDRDCLTNLCYFDICMGLLLSDKIWMQEKIYNSIKNFLEKNPNLKNDLILNLITFYKNENSIDKTKKGRLLSLIYKLNNAIGLELARNFNSSIIDYENFIKGFILAKELKLPEAKVYIDKLTENKKILNDFLSHLFTSN